MRLNFSLVCMVYALASVVTFIAYAMDKSAAKQNGWRISERTLQLMALFCGWPGGWLAQKWLRQKTLISMGVLVDGCGQLHGFGGDCGDCGALKF